MEELNYTVYMHTNKINDKSYIGITSKPVQQRWGKKGYRYKANKHFWNAIQKYGWDNFEHEVLFSNIDKEQACKIEKMFIRLFMTQDPEMGYNSASGGEINEGFHLSEETKQKLSQIFKERPMLPIWEFAAEKNKGKILSEEHKRKLYESRKGHTHSAEARKKMSDALKGENHPNYGRHLSEETRQKISEKNKGKFVQGKPVYCVEIDKSFESIKDAADFLEIDGSHIACVCRGKRESTYGYHFKYVDEIFDEYQHKERQYKKVYCIELDRYFSSASEASKELNIGDHQIRKACRGKAKTAGGYHWEYIDVEEAC